MKLEDSAFDAKHYDLRIGRALPEPTDTVSGVAAALAAARAHYDVVFLRLAEADPLRAAIDQPPIDVLVTSTYRGGEPPARRSPATVALVTRLDSAADLAAVTAVTEANHWTSHLHADPRLPPERTRALYNAWAHNDVTARAQATITARVDDRLVGYITVLDRAASVVIDLVAVHPSWHGQGIGGAMLETFVRWLGDRAAVATVGTQASNPALDLYKRYGFEPTAVHVTYHLWSK